VRWFVFRYSEPAAPLDWSPTPTLAQSEPSSRVKRRPACLPVGVADDVRSTDDGVTYEFSYLFGLRSTEMTVETRVNAPDAGGDDDTLEWS